MIHLHSLHIGHHDGDIRLANDLDFYGYVAGTVTVPPGRRLSLHGRIAGDLILQKGAQAAIRGTVCGTVLNYGADVWVSGMVGSVRDMGDRRTRINSHAAIKNSDFETTSTLTFEVAISTVGTDQGRLAPRAMGLIEQMVDTAGKRPRAGWTSWVTDDQAPAIASQSPALSLKTAVLESRYPKT